MKDLAKKGRYGDDTIAHVDTGEMILPKDVVSSESGMLRELLMGHGYDPARYTVGGENSINPETGLPEFWGFKSFFKKFLPIIASVAPMVLGLPPLPSAALGAAAGGLSGGGLKGALLGGISGGLAGGGGSALAGMAGLSGAPATALSGALTGAATGLASGGGLKSALLGGALGGAGGYALGGGFPDLLGTAAGSPLAGGAGPTQGSGIIGKITEGASNLGSGMGSLTNLQTPMTLLSGLNSFATQGDVEEQLKAAQEKALGAISPYERTGGVANLKLGRMLAGGTLGGTFSPGDLTKDPGYQFRLQQGEQALNRSQAAKGNVFSGEALKAAQEYGQGLADQTYNDAYQRWLSGQQNTYNMLSGTAGRGMQAAGAMGDIYGNIGNIGGAADVARSNILTGTLSSALRGDPVSGFDKSGMVQGAGLSAEEIAQLRRMGRL